MGLEEQIPADHREAALVTPGGTRPGWAPEDGDGPVARAVDAEADDSTLAGSMGDATAAFIDGAVEAPLSLVRRLHRLTPGIQVAIVAGDEVRERLERSMLFKPGIGEVWLVSPNEVTPELLERATDVGRRRREHARRGPRLAQRVADLETIPGRRPFLADQYLATLVELLPDPVMALDEDDAVVFVNPAAAEILGIDSGQSVPGRELLRRLEPGDEDAWRELLDRGRQGVVRAQIPAGRPGSRRVYSAAVGPVPGERPVRAVLLHDVTEEVEGRERLAARAEELRTLMEHRSRFYSSMSHELRTPINAIVGYMDLLEAEIYGNVPAEQRAVLDRIGRATRHLVDLVDDTLDLSKIEAGKIEVRPERLDVRQLGKDLEATLRPLAEERGVDLRFELDPSCRNPFSTDPRRLRQILANLLSNAIRYGEGAPVEVRCRLDDGRLVVEVEDRGPGIPESQRERIFEEFAQLEEGEDGGDGGTGLGLAISRALARALGGDLTVESEEGRGSVFRVELPELQEGSG